MPEKWGGLGASPLDLVVACEELGHHAVPGPVAESLAAVPALLAALDDTGARGERGRPRRTAVRGEWLAGLAAGDLIATLAMPPRLPFAADAEAAGLVLLAEAGAVYRLATPGATAPVGGSGPVAVRGAAARQRAGPRRGRGRRPRALDLGALACAAQLLGAGRALLEASVRHAAAGAVRPAGRRVPGGQASARGRGDRAGVRPAAARRGRRRARGRQRDGGPDGGRDVSAAKVACADAAYRAARAALQVHGAIGYTAEHDLSLWLAKVRALVPAWGSQAEHRARVVAGLT